MSKVKTNTECVFRKILILLLSLIVPGISPVQAEVDPVVIRFNGEEITRSEFEERFEIVMIIHALQSGAPVKNQDQIWVMEHQYLDLRATEMVLLNEADKRGITVSDEDLNVQIEKFFVSTGLGNNLRQNLELMGFRSEDHLREFMREKQLIHLLIEQLKGEPVKENNNGEVMSNTVNQRVASYRKASIVETYPDKL